MPVIKKLSNLFSVMTKNNFTGNFNYFRYCNKLGKVNCKMTYIMSSLLYSILKKETW